MYAHQHAEPGDAGEFGDLYERYQARLVRYCRQRLRGVGEAEDAAHEALLRALQAWSRLDRTLDAWPWLATIAARVCADMRRRSARMALEPAPEQPTPDVHDLAMARLRASIIDDALDRLPARYRNPLVLKEFAGWSYRDIARLEGTSVASVRSNIMRSRRHLGARVEAVARTQGQWPLPVVVPRVTARLRHRARTWRQVLVRALDPTMVVTGLAFAMHPVSAGGTALAAAIAAVVVVGAPAAAPASPPSAVAQPATPRSNAQGEQTTSILTPSAVVAPTVGAPASASRETLSRIDQRPVDSSQVSLRTRTEIGALDGALSFGIEVRARTEPTGERVVRAGSTLPCGESDKRIQREACTTVSDAVRPLPD